MNNLEIINNLKKYSKYSSFTIYGKTIDDLSVFDNLDYFKSKLNTKFIFVGLNGSDEDKSGNLDWKPFHYAVHNNGSRAYDYRIKTIVEDNKELYGSYITDIFKDKITSNSKKISDFVSKNLEYVDEQINMFNDELSNLSGNETVIFAFGSAAYEAIIKLGYKNKGYKCFKLTHFSYRYEGCGNDEVYRKRVNNEINRYLKIINIRN